MTNPPRQARAVFQIIGLSSEPQLQNNVGHVGSGFLIAHDREGRAIIATNEHVVREMPNHGLNALLHNASFSDSARVVAVHRLPQYQAGASVDPARNAATDIAFLVVQGLPHPLEGDSIQPLRLVDVERVQWPANVQILHHNNTFTLQERQNETHRFSLFERVWNSLPAQVPAHGPIPVPQEFTSVSLAATQNFSALQRSNQQGWPDELLSARNLFGRNLFGALDGRPSPAHYTRDGVLALPGLQTFPSMSGSPLLVGEDVVGLQAAALNATGRELLRTSTRTHLGQNQNLEGQNFHHAIGPSSRNIVEALFGIPELRSNIRSQDIIRMAEEFPSLGGLLVNPAARAPAPAP